MAASPVSVEMMDSRNNWNFRISSRVRVTTSSQFRIPSFNLFVSQAWGSSTPETENRKSWVKSSGRSSIHFMPSG